jgi:hypothetical protein
MDIEAQAREQGWVPQAEFRGPADQWRSAEEFLERGEKVLPIVKSQLRRTESELARLTAENRKLAGMFQASQESITELQAFHEQNLKERLAAQKRDLAAQLAAAREDGDVAGEVEIQTQIAALGREVVAEKPAVKPAPEIPPQPQLDPAFVEWQKSNTWFGVDVRKTKEAMGIAQLIEADPANEGLVGAAFFQRVSEELARRHQPGGGASKVGSGRPSGEGGGGGGSGARAYDALPSDAKEACDSRIKKMVGEGRAFKTSADWQSYYAKIYFDKE